MSVVLADFSEAVYNSIITDQVIQELRPHNVLRPFLREAPGNIASQTYDFLLFDTTQDGFATASVESPAEGVDFTVRNVALNKAFVTSAVRGIMSTVSTLSEEIPIVDTFEEVKGVLVRTFNEHWESTGLSTLPSLTANSGVTPANLTVDYFLASIAQLEAAEVTGPLVSILHVAQQGDLRADIQSKTTSYWMRESSTDTLDRYQPEGYVGSLFGVPVYQTTAVPSAGGDYIGGIFVRNEALGYLSNWDVRVETERDASRLTTEIVLSSCNGFAVIDAVRGVTVRSNV